MSALRSARENCERLFLRPPKGNLAFYPRDYVSSVASSVARQWSSTGPNAAKREVALALLLDPELRLRVCHLEDILKAKQLHARQQSATGSGSSTTTAGSQGHNNGECDAAQASQARGGSPPLPPLVQLQTALADPSFAALFELDPCITEPDWGMQVLWLNMTQLAKELGMAPPPSISPPPPSGAARSAHSSPSLPNGSTQPPTTVTVTPELAKLLSTVEAFFPEYGTDDDVYLAVAACYSLVTRRDPDGQLPPYTLHVSDLATTLRAFATADPRLAAVLQRTTAAPADGQNGGGRSSTGAALPLAPTGSASGGSMVARVGEVLCGPRGRGAFRVGDSPSRRGERAVSLMLEQLLRGLGSGGCASGRSPSGANSAPGVVLPGVPLGAWQQAAAASTSSNGASEASGGGGGGLPVFLYEYESPGDAAAARKLQEQQQQQPPQGNPGERPANVIGSRSASGGGAPGPAPQITLPLHHAWSDGPNAPRASADANANGTVPPSGASQMHPAASEPLLLSPSGNLASSVPSSLSHVHTFQRRSSEAVTNGRGGESDGGYASALAGLANLALGFGSAWTQSSPADSAFAVGSFGGTSGMRLPMFQRQSSSSVGPNGNGLNDPANQNQGDAAMAAAAAMLGASPGGPGSELMHVPREIANVWANSGNAAAAAAMQQHQQQQHQQQQQQHQQHHQHQANMLAAAAAAMAAEAQQQLFAMSPPSTESGFPWNSRSHGGLGLGMGLDMSNVNRQASLGNPLTANGLQQAQLGLSLSGYMPQTASGTDANGMVVGSAPGGLHHTPHGFTTANGLATINGNTNMGYAAWPSSSPDVSMSTHALFSGRSAPSTDNGSNGPWLMTHGSLPGAAGGSPHVPPGPIASVVQGAAGAGLGGAVGGPQPPSLSEDSEEVSSGAGGLVDPLDVALSLEAIIGYEPTASGSELSASTAAANSTASSVSARRGLLPNADATAAASATVTGVSPPRGSIAAAVSHKPPLAANGLAAAGTKTFSSVAAALSPAGAGTKPQPNGTGTGSCTSSIDSSEALIQASRVPSACLGISSSDPQVLASPAGLPISSSAPNGAGAAVLSGWSALAARNAQQQQQQQQLQMHAAAAGSALISPTGHHHRMGTTAQAVAAVQAAQAASLLAGAAAAAAGSKLMAQSLPSGGGVGMAVGLGLRDPFGGKVLHPRLTPRVRDEIAQLLRTVPGLKAEDFDDGVLHQLTLKKSEEEAVGALRMLAADNGCGLAGIQHMAAYINHVIKNYHHLGGPHGAVGPGGAGASLPSATVRANSTPVSSKAILQKLPLRVYKRLEEMIATCSYMEWKHFDAGVVKVMAQLAEIGEEDVFEELELLKSTDLSNVEYMPAYLNKRLNNRLWSRRKMLTSVAGAGL